MTRKKKRAIALAGGGPAAGLHIGALAALEQAGIEFDVFALSCIGAWVGIVYNTREGENRAQQTYDFFEAHCFRDDESYQWFPINKGFATDIQSLLQAWALFPSTRDREWRSLVMPEAISTALSNSAGLFIDPSRWTNQEMNNWVLNDVLAVNPVTRYLTALVYNSEINGLSKIYYKGSKVLGNVFRCKLSDLKPDIYHNAWQMPDKEGEVGKIQIFHNHARRLKDRDYLPITDMSLCACSALPYIEESIFIDPHEYTEGALVDTVNFTNLLQDHPDLDEIWVNRIVDDSQVTAPRNVSGALANLAMQFAAEVGENDVKLFRQHLLNQTRMGPRVVEIPIVPGTKVRFEWTHSNLRRGVEEGYKAVNSLLQFDEELGKDTIG